MRKILALLVLTTLLPVCQTPAQNKRAGNEATSRTVLLELFTSQG